MVCCSNFVFSHIKLHRSRSWTSADDSRSIVASWALSISLKCHTCILSGDFLIVWAIHIDFLYMLLRDYWFLISPIDVLEVAVIDAVRPAYPTYDSQSPVWWIPAYSGWWYSIGFPSILQSWFYKCVVEYSWLSLWKRKLLWNLKKKFFKLKRNLLPKLLTILNIWQQCLRYKKWASTVKRRDICCQLITTNKNTQRAVL